MLSLRMLGRAAPKSLLRPSSTRALSSISRQTFLRPSLQSFKKPSYPAFSTSISRREPAGESDLVLSEKLNQERSLELESRDTSQLPEEIKEFLDNSSWKILDTPGTHDVALNRTFGNEEIKIEFSIMDMIEDPDAEEDMEDNALADEDYDQPKTINQSGAQGGKIDVAPEDSIAPADRGEPAGGAPSQMPPEYEMHFDITITKPQGNTISIAASAQDGAISIDHISYGPVDPNQDQKYSGPPMSSLDPDLQAMFEQYLEERGVDANVVNFAFAYNDYKEQREYVDWLQKLKAFVDT